MAKSKRIFPVPQRPMEFVAVILIILPTLEGPAYLFMAYDPFRDKIFNQQVEADDGPESLLKFIYFLAEDPLFPTEITEGFTLVLNKYEHLADRMQRIITPLDGNLLFDAAFHNQLTQPVLEHFQQFLKRRAR
jgi:hypothetical protein